MDRQALPPHLLLQETQPDQLRLLRQYFPKGSDFSALTVESVNRVVAKINLRPRKRLGWKTPYEVYAGVSVALMG